MLDDIMVLDLSRVLAGPYAGMLLGDLGARVIKVERRNTGDDTRRWGPPFVEHGGLAESTYFLSVNRNKESVVLDLKEPADLERLRGLIRRADVLIENFSPGVMQRLGLGHETLREMNRKLVILSITGFGDSGPERERTGYDQIVQGEAGIMSLTGSQESGPSRVGIPISDILAGLFGVYGILAALHERDRSGEGQVLKTSLLAATVGAHVFQGTRWLLGKEVPGLTGNRHPTIVPYQTFECADGLIQIAVGNEPAWRRFAPLVGIDPDDAEYSSNELRVANQEVLERRLQKELSKDSVSEWLSRLDAAGIPAGRVKTLDEVYASEQVHSQNLVLRLQHAVLGELEVPGLPVQFERGERTSHDPPPMLGEHQASIDDLLHGLNAARREGG